MESWTGLDRVHKVQKHLRKYNKYQNRDCSLDNIILYYHTSKKESTKRKDEWLIELNIVSRRKEKEKDSSSSSSSCTVKPQCTIKSDQIHQNWIKSMAQNRTTSISSEQEEHIIYSSSSSSSMPLVLNLMSKRRTWVFLFVFVYTILLSLSWNLLKSVLSWYESKPPPSSSSYFAALYASVLLGAAFGVLSMVAALAVAVPATLVTWISVLVLLTFCGKPRKTLVVEGKKLTGEITGFVVKVLIKEGNVVAAVCALLGYFALVRKNNYNKESIHDFWFFHYY